MDLYEVLGVRKAATAAEVRRAWQRKSRALHPALNPGDPVAAAHYRVVARAWEVLSDPKRRGAYDRGEREPTPVEPVPEGGFEGFDFSAGVRVEKVTFREMFHAALRPPEASPDAMRGEDLEQATRVSFDESMSGAVRRLHLVRSERCPACQGSGDVAHGPVSCRRCHGQRAGAGQPGPHDLLPTLPRVRRNRHAVPPLVLPLRGRRPGLRQRVAGGQDPPRGERRQPGSAARGRERRPPWRPRRRLRADRRGGAPSRLPAGGRRPALRRPDRDDRRGHGRARRGGDPDRTGDDRGTGGNAERPALPPAEARRAPSRGERAGRPLGRGSHRHPGRDRGSGPRPPARARAGASSSARERRRGGHRVAERARGAEACHARDDPPGRTPPIGVPRRVRAVST